MSSQPSGGFWPATRARHDMVAPNPSETPRPSAPRRTSYPMFGPVRTNGVPRAAAEPVATRELPKQKDLRYAS